MNLEFLHELNNITFKPDEDFTNLSTLKLTSRGDLILVHSVEALKKLLKAFNEKSYDYFVIGWGSNLLLPERITKPVIKLDFSLDLNTLKTANETYVLPANMPLNKLTAHAIKFGLKGWEVFTGIPASLGGAIFMNAGTNLGEIGEITTAFKVISKMGKERIIETNKDTFSYRKNNSLNEGDIIVEVTLHHHGVDTSISSLIKNYLQKRSDTQPLDKRTCGCVFKNAYLDNGEICPAGKTIDELGLKEMRVGDLKVSSVHANFVENHGQATYEQMKTLISQVKEKVKKEKGFEFEVEVKSF